MNCKSRALAPFMALFAATAAAVDIPLAIDSAYSGNGFYRYCPSVVDSGGVRHVFYCRNANANWVVDYIYHATVSPSGALSDESIVLSPADSTGSAWDSYHVCDPSVISGRFWYNGRFYRYLMAYLGVKGRPGDSASDGAKCINNKVGLAVSDSLSGGWTRMGSDCVVATGTPSQWGVGQPSIVSLDGAGKVALFYAGDYGTRMLELDFGDAEAASASLRVHIGDEGTAVSRKGVSDLKGAKTSGMTITNGDFAWNRKTGCLYLSVDTPDRHDGWYDDGGYYMCITKAVTIYRAHLGTFSATSVGAAQWEKMGRIYPNDLAADFSSSFRVHNSGLARTPHGALSDKMTFVTVAHVESNFLYTYRFVPVRWGSGADWFDGGLGSPGLEPWGGAWTPSTEKCDGKVVVDESGDQDVAFQADKSRKLTANGRIARVALELTFQSNNELQPLDADVKAGIFVHDGSYWGVGADPDGGASNVWRRLSGKAPVLDSPVPVVFEILRADGKDMVSYMVDGETIGTFPLVLRDRDVSKVSFSGSGVVSSLAGSTEGDWSEGMRMSLR